MKSHNPFLMTGLIALSALTSFLFIWYGMGIITSDKAVHAHKVFAYVTSAYGLANVSILSIAWSSREAWADMASKFIAISYLGVFVMDTINSGTKGAGGVAAILILSLVLCLNWLAVKLVMDRP